MKRLLLVAGAALLLSANGFAGNGEQIKEEIKMHFKPYGFIRTYGFYDTRATKALSEDLFFFIPLDTKMVDGTDVNAVGNFGYQAISTRLGLDIKDYKVGNTNIEGKIEADFYCLNSGGNVGTLRMRQAFVKLLWNPSEKFSHDLLIGQSWHPLAADLAHSIALETGAPFSPFNRSAQLMYNAHIGKNVTLTTGFIEQLQYRSNGPDGSTNKYQRRAILPELYAGISFKTGGFLSRAGVSALSLRPHYGYYVETTLEDQTVQTNKKYNEWLTTFNAFVFLQYTGKNFQVKAKSVFAQSGEHMQLSGGYAATSLKEDGISYEYAPDCSSVNFVSVQFGKKFQGIGMIGYQKNLGILGNKTALDVNKMYYFSGNGFKTVNQMLRFSPTFAYNLGKLQFALEYDYTMVQYGTKVNPDCTLTEGLHWIANHRILAMAKFNF